MRRLRGWLLRLGGAFDKGRRDREFKEELESHLQMHIDDNLRSGMSPAEARRQALIKLGGVESTREAYRDQLGLPALETLWRDISYGARQLRRNPGFAAVVVLTLALGIGANTAIFSVVNAVLLRPLPYTEPDRLVQLGNEGRTIVGSSTFLEVRAGSRSLERIAAYVGNDLSLTGAGTAERVSVGAVTEDFFPLLGVQPALGRDFTQEEQTPNGPRAVILGHAMWQSRFGGDPTVLGRAITLNQEPYTVVGILPASFVFPDPFQLWTSLPLREQSGEGGMMLLVSVIGRLRPDVTIQQAQTELRTIVSSGRNGGESSLTLMGLHERVVGDVREALLVLLGAVGLVLLIACANVVNLLLARAATRQREVAVRSALGAGRWRIARQLLTESLLLSLLGGAMGLLLALGAVEALARWGGSSLPAMQGIGVDVRVLAFTLGISLITGLAFGLAPAFQAWRVDANAALNEGGRAGTGARASHLRNLLVVSEMALALVLLIGAGLLIRSFSRLLDVDPGFRAEGLLTFRVNLNADRFAPGAAKVDFVERVGERIGALPGVELVAATDALPLTHFSRMTSAEVEGQPPIDWSRMTREEAARRTISVVAVTPNYFRVLGIPVRTGRAFTTQDSHSGARVVVVNESFARLHFPGESAVGRRIRYGLKEEASWHTVVGIVADVRHSGLASDVMPEVYGARIEEAGSAMSFAIRVAGEPGELAAAVRAAVAEVDPSQPIFELMTMEQRLASTTSSRRLNTALLSGFAAAALLLAVVGIYGLMSYAVTQRQREIGVRMALGARWGDVLGLVLGNGLRLTLVGVAIGLIGALVLTRYLSSLLYSVNATDPITYVGVAIALIAAALLASWLPARRAAKVDPVEALRGA